MFSLPYKTILTLALFSVLSPFLGLPELWRDGLIVVSGLVIFFVVGFAYHRERRIIREDEQKHFSSSGPQESKMTNTADGIDGITLADNGNK